VNKKRLARALFGATIAAAPLAVVAPADASSANVGTHGLEARCYSANYAMCLYWTTSNSAYWPANKSWPDLTGHKFFSGTGSGSGQVITNNAEYMFCSYAKECRSYSNYGWIGNYDYALTYTSGTLYYSKDRDLSVNIAQYS
jgi:hypothetical protein